MNNENLNFKVPSKAKMVALAFMVLGLISIIAMFMSDHVEGDATYHQTRAWSNLFGGAFF